MALFIITGMLMSLTLTLILELGLALVIGIRNKRDILLVLLVNVITNPVVVLTFYLSLFYTSWNLTIVKWVMEILAVLVEAWLYKKYSKKIRHPFLFSICMNVFSYFTGLALNPIITEVFHNFMQLK